MLFPPASGVGVTGGFIIKAPKVIRLLRKGCTNRPFYHIVVAVSGNHQSRPVIEQLGTYDPMPNEQNERLVSLNFERISYWIGNGVTFSTPTAQLLGLAGYLPIHPTSYISAWRNRQKLEEEKAKELEISEQKEANASQ
ncbi:probable 28S ribosomal protein S16, mitochondrial [Sitophilus oryzae]|uniref:Small ribosomal subunit protein bS16m n=1 Tax=Sitophilus oryzae TaxID=7048 RepID=A0A6J2Y758_SITOR|nr:probable 28S ribosomal protein S16, mitochondrial [Sitophilus oryzae]